MENIGIKVIKAITYIVLIPAVILLIISISNGIFENFFLLIPAVVFYALSFYFKGPYAFKFSNFKVLLFSILLILSMYFYFNVPSVSFYSFLAAILITANALIFVNLLIIEKKLLWLYVLLCAAISGSLIVMLFPYENNEVIPYFSVTIFSLVFVLFSVSLLNLKIFSLKDLSNFPSENALKSNTHWSIFSFLHNSKGFTHLDEYSYHCKNRHTLIKANLINYDNQSKEYASFVQLFTDYHNSKDYKVLSNIYKKKVHVLKLLEEKGWLKPEIETCSGKVVYTKDNHFNIIFSDHLKRFQIIYKKYNSEKKTYYWWSSKYYLIDEILGFEVRDGSKTILEDTRVRNALMGNLIFGKIGAAIGASLSSNNIKMLIKLNDLDNPIHEIEFNSSKSLHELMTVFQIYETKWMKE